MSAKRLRDAALALRMRGEMATPGPWEAGRTEADSHGLYSTPVFMPEVGCELVEAEREDDARFIATMHPGVALALADWLDRAADEMDVHLPAWERGSIAHPEAWGDMTVAENVQHHYGHPLTIADLILGGAS